MNDSSVIVSTLRALIVPKRLLPICLLVFPIVGLEWHYGNDPYGVLIVMGMGIVFPSLAPIAWRALLSRTDSLHLLKMAAYALIGSFAVILFTRLFPWLLHMDWTLITDAPSQVAALVIFWVGGWSLGRDIDLENSLQQQIARNKIIAREAAHAQVMAMQRHLDPHFVFNTLNAIAEWCSEDAAVAESATLRLSNMLRTVFNGLKNPSWSMKQELQLVDDLVALYQVRDPDKFTLEQHVQLTDPSFLVPPMILLTVSENAIKHGPWAGHTGPIRLSVRQDDAGVHVILSNPGSYAGPRPGSDGIAMLTHRLDLVYKGQAAFEIAAQGERTEVKLHLPPMLGETP